MDLNALAISIPIGALLCMIIACLSEVVSQLERIADLLALQAEQYEDDDEPDGPDEGEPAPPPAISTIIQFKKRA